MLQRAGVKPCEGLGTRHFSEGFMGLAVTCARCITEWTPNNTAPARRLPDREGCRLWVGPRIERAFAAGPECATVLPLIGGINGEKSVKMRGFLSLNNRPETYQTYQWGFQGLFKKYSEPSTSHIAWCYSWHPASVDNLCKGLYSFQKLPSAVSHLNPIQPSRTVDPVGLWDLLSATELERSQSSLRCPGIPKSTLFPI